MDEECEWFSNSKSSVSAYCLAFAFVHLLCQLKLGVAYKNVSCKKGVQSTIINTVLILKVKAVKQIIWLPELPKFFLDLIERSV